jgi:hypothetical protein
LQLIRERSSSSRTVVEEFPVRELARGTTGDFEFHGDRHIALEPGPNSYTIVAVNAGGEASAECLFTYTPPPIRVVIDGVQPRAGGGRWLAPQARAAGPPALSEPLPESTIVLRGRVIWADAASMRVSENPRLQVWVNGFPHVAVSLGPGAEGRLERAFRAEALLSRLEDNEIDLRLGGAPLDILGDRKLLISCRKVVPNWRLHLLVIGIGPVDRQELRDRALAALNGREFHEEDGTFQTPAFPVAKLYGPGRPDTDIHRPWMLGRLRQIRKAIAMGPRPSNEVVILYYQGGEVIEGREPCLRLRPGSSLGENDIFRLSEIRERLSETRGAKLFLLDVTHARHPAPVMLSQAAQWIQDDSPFGVLRFAWQGNSSPADASLATTLGDAIKDKATLEEVSAEVDRQSQVLRKRYPSLQYLPELTRYLGSLVLGGP